MLKALCKYQIGNNSLQIYQMNQVQVLKYTYDTFK